MAEDAPAGYYVGRPVNQGEQKTQPPPPPQPADEQVNGQVPGACSAVQTRAFLSLNPDSSSCFFKPAGTSSCFGKRRVLCRPCPAEESRRRRAELRRGSVDQRIGLPCRLFRVLHRRQNCKLDSVEDSGYIIYDRAADHLGQMQT